ncbi:MAG: cytochrome c oxidase subunit 3 [Gammaproteobacteria bacterium]
MTDAMQLAHILPVGSAGKRSAGWWGIMSLIVTEGSLFGYLLFSYFYLASQTEQHWPPEGLPRLLMPGMNTVILLSSSVFIWASERCLRVSRQRWSLASIAMALMLGFLFVAIQLNEWRGKPYDLTSNLYGSLYFTITGFHMLHVIVGLIILMLLLVWIALGYFDHKRHAAVSIGGLYWHFVDVVWLFVFSTLYLLPYLS